MDALTAWLMLPDAPDPEQVLEELLRRPAWHERASCRGAGAGDWVKASDRADYAVQRAICARCPVVQECLQYALENDVQGCWGGTDERERRELRRAVA